MHDRFRLKSLTPLVAMVVLFVITMVFSLARVWQETDAIDAERTRAAVKSSVEARITRLVALAEDNAISDDAFRAVYGDSNRTGFFWNTGGVATAEAKAYQTMIVLDARGKQLIAFRRGRQVRVDPERYSAGLAPLLEKFRSRGQPVGGVIASTEGPQLAAASPILPASPELDKLVPQDGASILILFKAFDADVAQAIGKSLILSDTAIGQSSRGLESITLTDPKGRPVATLSWDKPSLGWAALQGALPWIVGIGLLHVVIGMIIGVRGLRSIAQFANQAFQDSLSQLPNRRALRSALARRLGGGQMLALAMIDLDGFKGINDIYGHAVGDRLIKAVAAMLKKTAGGQAMVARLGGDEFAILVGGADATARIEDIAREILAELAHPFRIDERTVFVGASIGLACATGRAFDASELMRRADAAMYAAKTAGKMRLNWFDEMLDQKQAASRTIEAELRDAIEQEAFEIAYQPIVGAATQRIVGVEALLRWESPSRGSVAPSDFIAVAQETGLIDSIGKIALRRACQDALAWPELFLAVNMSLAQLRNPCFAEDLAAILEETGFPADRLELELTEAFLVYDADIARRVLNEIRALGVGLALDDFGSGFSAVAHLRQFPFGKVKIDRSLVNAACQNDTSRVVLQAGVTVARAMKLQVAAEGVETGEHRDLMRVAGCDLLQGWLYSKPGSAERITARIEHDYAPAQVAAG